ncbi:MAG TPA: hypothetical protein DEA73_06610, partial [Peptococcaceae bacterium]|nr:hypothetical protein [Peptococcaceae bacterium]
MIPACLAFARKGLPRGQDFCLAQGSGSFPAGFKLPASVAGLWPLKSLGPSFKPFAKLKAWA